MSTPLAPELSHMWKSKGSNISGISLTFASREICVPHFLTRQPDFIVLYFLIHFYFYFFLFSVQFCFISFQNGSPHLTLVFIVCNTIQELFWRQLTLCCVKIHLRKLFVKSLSPISWQETWILTKRQNFINALVLWFTIWGTSWWVLVSIHLVHNVNSQMNVMKLWHDVLLVLWHYFSRFLRSYSVLSFYETPRPEKCKTNPAEMKEIQFDQLAFADITQSYWFTGITLSTGTVYM